MIYNDTTSFVIMKVPIKIICFTELRLTKIIVKNITEYNDLIILSLSTFRILIIHNLASQFYRFHFPKIVNLNFLNGTHIYIFSLIFIFMRFYADAIRIGYKLFIHF